MENNKKKNTSKKTVKSNRKIKMKRCLGCMEAFDGQFSICSSCGYIEGSDAEEAVHMIPGSILQNRYKIGKSIGYGGFGVTYIAWDAKLEQKVAIKEYLPGEFSTRVAGQSQVIVLKGEKSEQFYDGISKFLDEAKRLAKFQNEPGIVRVYDSFEENDTAYIVTEYLDGETLTQKLKREKTIPENEAVNIITPVMESLKVVHKDGILHRDISPDNIMITKTGEVKLIDFGAARYATTTHSRSLTTTVKPGYTPVEQYRSNGDQGEYTDVYALAATLYKMITGKTPPDSMERLVKIENNNKELLAEPSEIIKDISLNRENAILNALNVNISDRTPDIETFMNELYSSEPAKRRASTIKRIDFYRWPKWLKILVPTIVSILLCVIFLMLIGVIKVDSIINSFKVPDGYAVVPNVENMSIEEANEKIEKEGLIASPIGNVESEYIDAGLVIYQTPNGNAFLEIGGKVEYKVSSGGEVEEAKKGKSTVPYVILDTESSAKQKLEKAGLKYSVTYSNDPHIDKGLVISQNIQASKEVDEGTEIKLVVSNGVVTTTRKNTTSKKVATTKKESTNNKAATTKNSTTTKKIVETYLVTFNSNGGSSVNSIKIEAGKAYGTLPAPTKSQNTFVGWYDKSTGSKVSNTSKPTSNVTLIAHWSENSYTEWSTDRTYANDSNYIEDSKVQYRYSDKQTTSSSNSSLSGWTPDGSTKTKTGSGTIDYVSSWPSGFSRSNAYYSQYNKSPKSNSETCSVTTSTIGYLYWHWVSPYCKGAAPYNCYISDTYGKDPSPKKTYGAATVFEAIYLTSPLSWNSSSGAYACKNQSQYSYWWLSWSETNTTQLPVKRCSYTTYSITYYYYKWSDFSSWSDDYISSNDNRKVETRTLYRYIKK